MAARSGVGLTYHRYLARAHGRDDGPVVASVYQASFRPNAHLLEPSIAVVCFGCCADDPRDAEELWRSARELSRSDPMLAGGGGAASEGARPDFLGSPEACRAQLEELAQQFGTCEVVLHCPGTDADLQRRQYELLAAAFGQCRGLSGSPRDAPAPSTEAPAE